MAEEIVENPVQEPQNQGLVEASGLDSELDDALSKTFKGMNFNEEPKNEQPKIDERVEDKNPDSKREDKTVQPDPKATNKEPKKEERAVEEEKPLPSPESLDETPQGKSQAAWTALKNNYKRSFKTIEQKDQEISKLKSAIAERSSLSQKESETLKSQVEELSKYRAMIDIQADPEFVSKFDQPIERVKDSIKALFKTVKDKATGNPLSDEIINSIPFTDTRTVDGILEYIEANGDKTTAKRIQRKIEELVELDDKRNEILSEQKNNYKQVLENKKKESFSKEAESEGKMMKHLEMIALGKDGSGNQRTPPIAFLNKINPKESATQPEIDQINNHNRMVDLMQQKVAQAMKLSSPEDKMEMIIAAVGSHYLAAQLKAAIGKISSLEETLKKISSVNSETEKVKPSSSPRNGNGQTHPDTEAALATFFTRR